MRTLIANRHALFAALWVALAAATSSCSTVPAEPSSRMGLLDKIAEMDQVSPRTRRFPSSRANGPGGEEERIPAAAKGYFNWPLKDVAITSNYGQRGSGFHEGLDLRARTGTPVLAAQAGTVIYSGSRIRGYGRMVVIAHLNGLTTVYAHQSRILVRKGQKVKQGQRIGLSGNTGRSTGPHLHFEVRHGVAALNPLRILPTIQSASADTTADAPHGQLVGGTKKRPRVALR